MAVDSFQRDYLPEPGEGGGFACLFPAAAGLTAFGPEWPALLRTRDRDTSGASPGQARVSPGELLDQARREAEALLQAARQEAERLAVTRAVEVATEVRREQTAAFETASQELRQALQAATEERMELLAREAALLVMDIVGRLVHEHFAADETAIVRVVREVLSHLSSSSHVQITVAAAHESAVRQAQQELAALLASGGSLEITISEDLTPGGCLAHGDRGSVDARLETRLEAFDQALRDAVA